MPIDKISDIRWLPLLGKIRLGIKKEGQHGTYPQAVDYFVVPDEVHAVYDAHPTELDIMFPSDDVDLVAPQWYECYSSSHGLICRGDGKHSRRKVDIDTGDFAAKNTRAWEMADGICNPDTCPMIIEKQCRKRMTLLFILPEVPGLGVYKLTTGSFYSIVNINSQIATDGFIRRFTMGKIAFIPLILSIGPQVVDPPGVGRITVQTLKIRADVKLADIIRISRQAPAHVLLPTLKDEDTPDDQPDELAGEEPAVPASLKLEESNVDKTTPSDQDIPASYDIDGITIDIPTLRDMLRAIHWSDGTAITWLNGQFKVDKDGTLEEVLQRLNSNQAQEFMEEVETRVNKMQMDMFQ